jgi:hypothetical protein
MVKVLDFGLAKIAEPASAGSPESSPAAATGATQVGQVMGTPAGESGVPILALTAWGEASPISRGRKPKVSGELDPPPGTPGRIRVSFPQFMELDARATKITRQRTMPNVEEATRPPSGMSSMA